MGFIYEVEEYEMSLDREHIVYQILDKDNWEVIDEIDCFIYVYDKMPARMRLVVDLKMTGNTAKEIAKLLGIDESTVRVQIHRAKKRILNALY